MYILEGNAEPRRYLARHLFSAPQCRDFRTTIEGWGGGGGGKSGPAARVRAPRHHSTAAVRTTSSSSLLRPLHRLFATRWLFITSLRHPPRRLLPQLTSGSFLTCPCLATPSIDRALTTGRRTTLSKRTWDRRSPRVIGRIGSRQVTAQRLLHGTGCPQTWRSTMTVRHVGPYKILPHRRTWLWSSLDS